MNEIFRPTVIRREAREALSGKWNAGALVALVWMVLFCAIAMLQSISVALYYVGFLAAGSFLTVGLQWIFLGVARGERPEAKDLLLPFRNYVRVLVAYVLIMVATGIGMVLFIVPGVILSLGLSMTFFILRDDEQISPVDAMKRSWAMMSGHKWEYFLLGLSFLGWAILACITVVGIFWLLPYMYTATGRFYERLVSTAGRVQSEEEV